MERMVSTKSNKRLLSSSLVLFVLLPLVSIGAEVTGGIRVGASHTDNVFLATSPDEIDDIVYQASPFLNFLYESPQLDARLDYAFDWYRYADLDSTSKFHSGEASLTSRALSDSLTTELGFRRSQTLENPENVIPSGSLPLAGNLIDEDEWWFNPNLSRRLGSVVNVEADYRYSKIQYRDDAIQDNNNQSGNLSIENYSAGRGMTWALRYDWRRTTYEISAPWEFQQATAELGFWANASTRIFASGGKESAWDKPFDPAMDESFWEAGFAYSPSDNLSAEFAAGERSFGSSFRGSLDYTFRRGSTSLSYIEAPTTTGYNQNGGTRPVYDTGEFDDFLDTPGNSERYLSERLQWTFNLTGRRTGFDLVVFDEDRSGRISADGQSLEDESQTGVTATFTWQAGVRTDFSAFGSIIDRETSLAGEDRYLGAGLDINYQIGTRSNVTLGYAYGEQEPRDIDLSGRDYVSNVVSLFFTYTM